MAIRNTVTESDFHGAFHDMNRADSFSYDARSALYNYLWDLSEDTGEDVEMDVIALCGEFTEYESAVECLEEYAPGDVGCGDDDCERANGHGNGEECEDCETLAMDYLRDRTTVIEFPGGIVIQDY